MNYAFRIKFYINVAGSISSHNREEIFLISSSKTAKLYCYNEKLSKASEIYIYSDGYKTEDDAKDIGEKLKISILIASSLRRIFVDVGKNRATSQIGKVIKEKLWEEHKVQLINEVHGLDVYDASKKTQIVKASSPSIILQNYATDLINDIQSLFNVSASLNEKDLLAFELYGASGFEKSSKSRFLTLMLSLESMIEQKKRPTKIINVIKDLLKSIDSMDLESDEMQSIKNGISMLKKESISKSGQYLSAKFLDSKKYNELDPSDFFLYCYKIRSNLVHNGTPKIPEHEFSSLTATLEVFVHDILESKIILMANKATAADAKSRAAE